METIYSYDELSNHFRALVHVLKYETVHLDYSKGDKYFEVGNDHSLETNIGRILDYFTQLEYTKDEKMYKAPRLAMLLNYLVEHFELFDQEHLTVCGTQGRPSLVKESLLKALHEHFCGSDWLHETLPSQIIMRANEFEDD